MNIADTSVVCKINFRSRRYDHASLAKTASVGWRRAGTCAGSRPDRLNSRDQNQCETVVQNPGRAGGALATRGASIVVLSRVCLVGKTHSAPLIMLFVVETFWYNTRHGQSRG